MKLQTTLTEPEIRDCLERAHADDLPADVVFDIFARVGSRSYPHAFEVHLASAQRDTRADGVKRKASSMAGGGGLRYAATYDEWGMFLAAFFATDPAAKAGPYKSQDDFHRKTDYAYAARDEMPPDEIVLREREADPEPYRAESDTAPTTYATLPVIQRIDDTLAGCWSSPAHP